jgi:hypothetical protein
MARLLPLVLASIENKKGLTGATVNPSGYLV